MLVELSIIPLDHGLSMKQEVAHIVEIIHKSGLNYQLTAMGTLLEGDTDRVWNLLRQCHEAMMQLSARVLTRIIIDDKKEAQDQLRQKVEDVQDLLSKPKGGNE